MDERADWHLTEALDHELGRGDPFAAAVRATRMPMVITDPRLPDNPIIYCNEAFQLLTGYARTEIVGTNCRFLQGPGTDRDIVARISRAIEAGQDIEAELLNYRKDGTPFWNALYLSPVRDDAGEIRYYFASQLNVTDRVNAERDAIARRDEVEREVAARTADLQQALEAKTLLLHELDHRVKNNLAMIGSLVRLQARASTDPAVASRLDDMLQRIDALSNVHRRLYQNTDITQFDVGSFALNMATELVAGANGVSKTDGAPAQIALVADVEPVEIAPNNASAIGLVVNELLTNALKHAFAAGRPGTLSIRSRTDAGTALIEISDDGLGLPADPAKGLGLTLIDRLSRQIGIHATWTALEPGTRVSLSFPTKHRATAVPSP